MTAGTSATPAHRNVSLRRLISLAVMLTMSLLSAAGADQPVPARPGMLVINEAASRGPYSFIEIKQLEDVPVILEEPWYVTDSGDSTCIRDAAVSIPAGTVLQPGSFLTIAPYSPCSDQPPEGIDPHAVPVRAFALEDRDEVKLIYQGKVTDRLRWETAVNSVGRDPDNPDTVTTELIPTPGRENRRISVHEQPEFPVFINEVYTGGLDYIELHNSADVPFSFSLGGWMLHSADRTAHFLIPEETSIPPGGFLVIYPGITRAHISAPKGSLVSHPGRLFELGERDSVYLVYQGNLVDSLSWYGRGACIGRYPDGSDTLSESLVRTPGAANRER